MDAERERIEAPVPRTSRTSSRQKGGLKGDAVVTFSSRATMLKAVDRLNHFEVKPGVIITATEATFSSKQPIEKEESKENTGAAQSASQRQSLADFI
ncbi:hypothetical protein GQ600_11147 [Phytophthora cactorum]|nr:hypothetical protein GQ600_11147 [Phytophthora cactorum]